MAKIERIEERLELTPEGIFKTVFRVHYKTKHDFRSYIEIPKEDFTSDLAKELVSVQAKQIEETIGAETD